MGVSDVSGVQGVLKGIRIIEIAGIGPGPFCGMLLADMGAEVIMIERADTGKKDPLALGKNAIYNRGKRSLALDLKDPRSIEVVLKPSVLAKKTWPVALLVIRTIG